MQGYLMRALHTSWQILHSTANACFYVCECYVCVVGSVGCGLKAEHGNIMDVLEEKNNFFFFVLSDMSLSLLPKQLIAVVPAYWLAI